MRGSQTAVVVSPTHGDPIYTDEYGRVKVHFHWDRRGKPDSGATSCWVRVSQNSAGAGFGGIAIPHAGQEVVVDFLEGDPDRPLIVGRVHNAEKVSPIQLPADKHKTITRDHGGNKILMDGEAGSQHLSLLSPKTMNFVVAPGPAQALSADAAGPPDTPTISGATIFSVSGQVFGKNPGMLDLNGIFQSLGTANQSRDSTDHCMNTVVSIDNNSFAGRDTNSYTLGNSNTFIKGDSNSHVHGTSNSLIDVTSNTTINVDSNTTVLGNAYSYTKQASKTQIDGPTYSTMNDLSETFVAKNSTTTINGDSTTTIKGTSYTDNNGNAYSSTVGLSRNIIIGFSVNTMVGNNNNITLAGVSNINAAGILNFGKAWSKDVVIGKRSTYANEVSVECDNWRVKSVDATFITDTFNVRNAHAVTVSASDTLTMGGSGATTKILGSTVSLSCTGKCELTGGMITLG